MPLQLPDRETLELLGELGYYLVEHPRRLRATQWIIRLFRGSAPARMWLRRLKKIEGVPHRSYDHYTNLWQAVARAGGDPRIVGEAMLFRGRP